MSGPRAYIVLPLEGAARAYVDVRDDNEEARVRADLHGRDDLLGEIQEALDMLLDALDDRVEEAP